MDQNKLVGGLEQFLDQTIIIWDPKNPPIISEYAVRPVELAE